MEIYLNTSLEDLAFEQWRDVVGYEGLYQVGNLGRVKSLKRRDKQNRKLPNIIKKLIISNGYPVVGLSKTCVGKTQEKKSHKVHRLVAIAFLPNLNNLPIVNHKDCNRNNNAVENLEWVSFRENIDHAVKNKRYGKPRVKPKNPNKDKFHRTINPKLPLFYFDIKIKLENEKWLPILGFETLFEISNYGRVKSLGRQVKFVHKNGTMFYKFMKEKLVKPQICASDRLHVLLKTFYKNKPKHAFLHRLVGCAFLDNYNNLPEINHIDGNVWNNHVDNLEWVSPQDNKNHAQRLGLVMRGERHVATSLTENDILEIRQLHHVGMSIRKLAKKYNLSNSGMSCIVNRITWKHI